VKIHPWCLLLIPILVLHLTGCTAAREMSLPDGTGDPGRSEVPVGKRVTVHLVGGDRITGDVVDVTPDGLTLGKAGNYGWEETSIASDQIVRIEIQEVTGFTRVMLVVTGVAVAAVLVLGVMFEGFFDGMGST